MGNSLDFCEKENKTFNSHKSYLFLCGNSSSAILFNYYANSSFPNLSQAGSTTSEDLKMSGNYLHCIFTAEANLNPSMASNAVLRPFIVGQ